jgi:hypothetical protein
LVYDQTTNSFEFTRRIVMLLPHAHAARPVTLPMPAAAVTAGLVPGTAVMTDQGALPVEHLFPGDRMAVAGGGFATLRRIERVRALGIEMAVLASGALPGQTAPLQLPSAQHVIAADWRMQVALGAAEALVPAGRLEDGSDVRIERRAVQTLVRLVFDKPQAIRAAGAWVACATPRPLEPARPQTLH